MEVIEAELDWRKFFTENQILKKSTKLVEHCFDIKLSLIEKVQLKHTINKVLDDLLDLKQGDLGMSRFDPLSEISRRFMYDYYGLPIDL